MVIAVLKKNVLHIVSSKPQIELISPPQFLDPPLVLNVDLGLELLLEVFHRSLHVLFDSSQAFIFTFLILLNYLVVHYGLLLFYWWLLHLLIHGFPAFNEFFHMGQHFFKQSVVLCTCDHPFVFEVIKPIGDACAYMIRILNVIKQNLIAEAFEAH